LPSDGKKIERVQDRVPGLANALREGLLQTCEMRGALVVEDHASPSTIADFASSFLIASTMAGKLDDQSSPLREHPDFH
jgi:hypothetical protein